MELETVRLLERGESWYTQRLPALEGRVRDRLDKLSDRLGDADFLDGDFSSGDLMMVEVLLRLNDTDIVAVYPHLPTYVARAHARSSIKPGFAAQLAVFAAKVSTG